MRKWGFNSWLKHQGHLGWSRLRIAEQEGRIASWQDGAPASSPADDGVHLDELLSRLKALYQENDALARQRDDWQAERERLENALAAERQRIEEARAEVASHQTLVEQQRAELQVEREGLSHALEHLKQEMLGLRQSLADYRDQSVAIAVQPQDQAQAQDEPESHDEPNLHDRESLAGESDANVPLDVAGPDVDEIGGFGDMVGGRDLNDDDDEFCDGPRDEYDDDLDNAYDEDAEDGYDDDLDDGYVDHLDDDYDEEYDDGEISITERLIRFGIEKKRRPVWVSGGAWVVGAALAASCGIAAWASFDSIKTWLSF